MPTLSKPTPDSKVDYTDYKHMGKAIAKTYWQWEEKLQSNRSTEKPVFGYGYLLLWTSPAPEKWIIFLARCGIGTRWLVCSISGATIGNRIYRVAQKKRPEHSHALCSKLLTDF